MKKKSCLNPIWNYESSLSHSESILKWKKSLEGWNEGFSFFFFGKENDVRSPKYRRSHQCWLCDWLLLRSFIDLGTCLVEMIAFLFIPTGRRRKTNIHTHTHWLIGFSLSKCRCFSEYFIDVRCWFFFLSLTFSLILVFYKVFFLPNKLCKLMAKTKIGKKGEQEEGNVYRCRWHSSRNSNGVIKETYRHLV